MGGREAGKAVKGHVFDPTQAEAQKRAQAEAQKRAQKRAQEDARIQIIKENFYRNNGWYPSSEELEKLINPQSFKLDFEKSLNPVQQNTPKWQQNVLDYFGNKKDKTIDTGQPSIPGIDEEYAHYSNVEPPLPVDKEPVPEEAFQEERDILRSSSPVVNTPIAEKEEDSGSARRGDLLPNTSYLSDLVNKVPSFLKASVDPLRFIAKKVSPDIERLVGRRGRSMAKLQSIVAPQSAHAEAALLHAQNPYADRLRKKNEDNAIINETAGFRKIRDAEIKRVYKDESDSKKSLADQEEDLKKGFNILKNKDGNEVKISLEKDEKKILNNVNETLIKLESDSRSISTVIKNALLKDKKGQYSDNFIQLPGKKYGSLFSKSINDLSEEEINRLFTDGFSPRIEENTNNEGYRNNEGGSVVFNKFYEFVLENKDNPAFDGKSIETIKDHLEYHILGNVSSDKGMNNLFYDFMLDSNNYSLNLSESSVASAQASLQTLLTQLKERLNFGAAVTGVELGFAGWDSITNRVTWYGSLKQSFFEKVDLNQKEMANLIIAPFSGIKNDAVNARNLIIEGGNRRYNEKSNSISDTKQSLFESSKRRKELAGRLGEKNVYVD